ncbi:MAG: radical SAM protein [bacterium]
MIRFKPSGILIERTVLQNTLTKHICNMFPRLPRSVISNASDLPSTTLSSTLILAKQQGKSIVHCPGTPHYLCCNYYIIDIGIGCHYNCSYCFLHQYQQHPGTIVYVNADHILQSLSAYIKYKSPFMRIGTGEFTDSLITDHITGYSKKFIAYFARQDRCVLELKTKGTNIDNLINLKHNLQTVIAWSLNPEPIIRLEETASASLDQRLNAAQTCQKQGYPVAFHFDPIIYSDTWETAYQKAIRKLTQTINPDRIVWISLGTLRFNPHMKQIIQKRFPKSNIIYEEMIKGLDGKLRYIQPIRIEIYSKMYAWLKKYFPKTPVYLCMESPVVWKRSLGFVPGNHQELETYIMKRWGQIREEIRK